MVRPKGYSRVSIGRPWTGLALRAGLAARRHGRATGAWTSSPSAVRRRSVARAMGDRVVMVDSSAEAAEVMRARLGGDRVVYLDAAGSELEQQIC